jgi:DNA-binding NarL/FixJ family response regulator
MSDLAMQSPTGLKAATTNTETDQLAISLSARQRDVLQLLSQGETNKIIAHNLGVSESTVNVHVRNLMKMLRAHNRTQVVIFTGSLLKR